MLLQLLAPITPRPTCHIPKDHSFISLNKTVSYRMTDHLETGTSTEEAPPCKCHTPSQVKKSGVYCKGSLYGFLNLLLVSEQLSLVSALQCLAGLVAEPRGDWRPQARLSGGCG